MVEAGERTKWQPEVLEKILYVNRPGVNIFGHRVNTKRGLLDRMLIKGEKIEVLSSKLDLPVKQIEKHIEDLKFRNVPIDINGDIVKIRV